MSDEDEVENMEEVDEDDASDEEKEDGGDNEEEDHGEVSSTISKVMQNIAEAQRRQKRKFDQSISVNVFSNNLLTDSTSWYAGTEEKSQTK